MCVGGGGGGLGRERARSILEARGDVQSKIEGRGLQAPVLLITTMHTTTPLASPPPQTPRPHADDFHLGTLQSLLGALPQLQPGVRVHVVLSLLMDRLAK